MGDCVDALGAIGSEEFEAELQAAGMRFTDLASFLAWSMSGVSIAT